ncbi:MAG: LamG domain-containing protein, partial [Gallionella sp.]|nr:LamG domain-containing protein [Gallionella sp.]
MLMVSMPASALTYTNAATTFSWIDATTHSKVGPATSPYKFSDTGGCGSSGSVIDDSLSDNIPFGFTFNYGGVDFSQARIMSNGRLQFNNNLTCGYGSPVTQVPYPNSGLNYSMRIYGNDLDPTAKSEVPAYNTNCLDRTTCYVSYATLGTAPNRKFVATWYHVPEWTAASTAGGSYDLQIILQENGEFIYQFGNDTPGPGNTNAQVGWQINSTDYAVPNVGFPATNSAIRFYIPSPISELRMDEGAWSGAGTVVNTSGGTNGTPIGLAQTVAGGKLCRGGSIPSNTTTAVINAVDTGYDVDSQIGSGGTVSFWYKSSGAWSGGGSSDGQLLDATVVNNRWFYLVKQNGNGRLSFNLTDSANNNFQVTTANNSFAANVWVHIAVTWNLTPVAANNSLKIFVNGVLAKSTAIGTIQPLSSAIGTLYMGDNRSSFVTNPGTGNSANGVIDEVHIYNYEATAAIVLRDYRATRTCSTLDHVRLNHTGSGVTCIGSSVTVNACNGVDGSGTCTADTSGLTGNVIARNSGGTTLTTVPFSIAAGSSSATVTVPVTAAQTVTFETSGLSLTPGNTWTCWNGSVASCSHVYNASGFVFDVPNHASEVLQTVNVSAVKTADNSLVCTPAFASVTKNVTIKCGYTNPGTGTLPVRVNGNALNASNSTAAACDAGGRSVSLSFNASGVASTTFQYADVGNMFLSATYTGSGSEAGLSMTGSDAFIAGPKDFVFSSITAAPIKAGDSFSATLKALNNAGVATPNFGKESTPEGVTLSFAKYQPTGGGAVNGSFSGTVGAFSGGAATGSNLKWSEVGTIDLIATLASGSYLGSALTATGSTGSTGAVGRFIPHHFDTVVSEGACVDGFTYSGQPLTLTVTAMNGLATPSITLNYDGSVGTTPNFSKLVALSEVNSVVGSLAPTSIAGDVFVAGVASAAPTFTFTSVKTAPAIIKLRAVDTDGVSSATATEGTAPVRSGRLRMQ